MAWRRVSSFVSSTLGLWLHSAPLEAAITHTTAKLNFEGERHPMPSSQPNFRRPDIEVIAFN
jgi:hypothetical protein